MTREGGMRRRGAARRVYGYGPMTVLSGHAVGFSRWVRAGQRSRVRAGRRKGAYGVRLGQIAGDAVIDHSQPASPVCKNQPLARRTETSGGHRPLLLGSLGLNETRS